LDKYQHESRNTVGINDPKLHPSIVQLGLQYANGSIRGSNARTMALLVALKQVTMDYVQPEHELMNRDFGNKLVPMIDYLKSFRPLSVGMGNALRHIKQKIPKLNPDLSEADNKQVLINDIEAYISERITVAVAQIVKHGVARIKNGDVILTYARSEVIEEIFVKAKEEGKDFRVIVVDSRPKNEGRELLQRLAYAGVKCSFIYINAVSHVMKEVSKVMIGAHSMLSNGSVFSRIGTAAVSMMANAYNIPVLVCCETYKFSESTQLDSITRNELGDPYELCSIDREDVPEILHDYESKTNIHVLNLTYDVTDMEYVDMVITEIGSIPPTSVAVILREYHQK
jgi:translation initiation factor eIF-2B subunit delta